jgi:hypothetical protein
MPWYRWLVAAYDHGYRLVHGLDRPEAQAGPLLRVEQRRLLRPLELADGTRLARGAPIGVVHLNNARVLALHGRGLAPDAIGFEFRRLLLRSLHAMARQAADGGPLAFLQAYSATTLFHRRLPRLGFSAADADRSVWRGFVSRYARALLDSLHPAGAARVRRGARAEARRLWISRARLLSLYGAAPAGDRRRRPRRAREEIGMHTVREAEEAAFGRESSGSPFL